MATIAIGDVLRTTIICQNQTQYSQNACHFVVTAKTGSMSDQEVCASMSSQIGALLKPCLSIVANYQGLRLLRVLGGMTQPVISTNGAGFGTVTGDPLPPQVSAVVKKLTTTGGRRGRGRIYIPFPSETSCSVNGILTSAYVELIEPFMDLMTSDFVASLGGNTVTLKMVLFTSGEGGVLRTVTNYTIRGAFGTQRRRSFINRGDANPL